MKSFDRKLEEIEALRTAPEASAREQLRRALKDRSNYVVGKAAAIAGDRQLQSLEPDLLAAFDRFMTNPVKSDPQCWAKNAIAKALKNLEYADPAVFLRGISHFQLEPVWGGRQDSAATLRGTCALALVACTLGSFEILTRLTDLLNDPETPVRMDATRAIAQLSAKEGALPLRLKALIGDREPEVTGCCLAALLTLEPQENLGFVAGFLQNPDPDIRLEAAGVLADSREPQAIDLLKEFWEGQTDPEVKRNILKFLAGSPVRSAADFLVSVLQDASSQTAMEALTALAKSRYRATVQDQVAAIVAARQDSNLSSTFDALFG